MDDRQRIDNILVTFDEMDFMPTTLLPDPEKARAEWKANLVAAIEEMDNKIAQILEECAEAINENRDLRRKCEQLQAKNADLKRTNEAIQKATAQDILQQIKDRGTPFIADIQELVDKYGVEVEE